MNKKHLALFYIIFALFIALYWAVFNVPMVIHFLTGMIIGGFVLLFTGTYKDKQSAEREQTKAGI